MKRGFLKGFTFSLIMFLLSCNPFDPIDPVTVDPPDQPKNDSYEPNNSITQASFIKPDSISNLICIPGEYDYYKFAVDSSSFNTIKIKPTNSLTTSSVSFYLYSKTGTSLKNSSLLSDSSRTISFFSGIRDTVCCYVYYSSSYTKEIKYSLVRKSQKVSIIDSTEPNNSKLAATLIANTNRTAFIQNASDTDWYKIPLLTNEYLTISITSDSSNISQVTPLLTRANGLSVSGSKVGNTTTYTYISSSPDTCYLKAYAYYSTLQSYPSRYTLAVTKTATTDDNFEENDTKLTAKLITKGNTDSLKSIGSDIDYYKFAFDTAMYIEAVIKTTAPSSTLYLALESVNSTLKNAYNSASVDSVKITYIVPAKDSMYLRVSNANSSATSLSVVPYSIELRATPISDDKFEENDTKLTAKAISGGKTDSLMSVGSDIDYYKFAFDTTMYIEAVLKTPSTMTSTSYLYLYLESVSSTLKTAYNYSSDSVKITYIVSAKDSLYLLVYNPNSTSPSAMPYSIELRATPISDDRFEENDTKLTAKTLPKGKTDSLKSVGSDIDYYKFAFDSAMYVEAVVKTSSIMTPSSYLYLNLESVNSTLINAYNYSTDSVKISFTAAANDSMYLKIFNPYSSTASLLLLPYSIELRAVPISKFDPLEPNDTKLTATLMDTSSLSSSLIAKNDTDYFKIPIAQNESINLNFTKATSSTFYSLLSNAIGNTISGTTSGLTTTFTYSSQKTDTLYLKVYNSSSATLTAPLNYSLTLARTKFIDDIYEENDTKLTAKTLAPGKYDTLKAFMNDYDYYKVSFDTPVILDAVIKRSDVLSSSSYMYLYLETISSTLTSTSTSTSDSLRLSYSVAAGDTVYVRVYYTSSSSTASSFLPYSLQIKATPIIEIDPKEPNDTRLSSIVIDSTTNSLIYSSTDIDWFKIPHSKDELLEVQIKTDSLKSQRVTSYLYNYTVTSIGGIALSSYTTLYTYSSLQDDTCYLNIKYYSGASSTPYQIIIKRTKIIEDKYEENDSKLTAKEIKIGALHDSLMSIGSDIDYYKFSVDTTSAINFTLRSKVKLTSLSYLSFSLESISSTLKSTSSYSYDSLQITHIVNPKDTLYLKVAGIYSGSSSQSAIPYSLDLKATPIADDIYEDNDTLSTAVKIPFGQYDLKYTDQDWFSIDVDSGATIRLDAELSSSTSSTVYMYLYAMPSTSLSTINSVSLALNSTTGFSYISTKKQTLYIAFRSTNFTGISELNYRFRVVQL